MREADIKKMTKKDIKYVIDLLIEYAKHNETDALIEFKSGNYKLQSHYSGRAAAFYRAADVIEKERIKEKNIKHKNKT
jgi:hypothetical protein